MNLKKTKNNTLVVLSSAIGATLSATAVQAVTSGYALPLSQSAINGNSNYQSGVCHHGQWACGNPDERWWANDLFDYTTDAPVLAMRPAYIHNSGFGCGESVRYHLSSGASAQHAYLNCHGQSGSRAVSRGDWVTQGQVIMKVGSTGTGTKHLHLEHRFLYDSNDWNQDLDYQAYCVGAEVGRINTNRTPSFEAAYRKRNGSVQTFNANCTWY